MGQLFSWVLHIGKGLAQFFNGAGTLRAQHDGAQNGSENHDRQGWPQAYRAAHLDEQADLDQGNGNEKKKKPHGTLAGCFTGRGLDRAPRIHMCLMREIPSRAPSEVKMSSAFLKLLVLAGIAIFLILKLRSVLGTREGFEKPVLPRENPAPAVGDRRDLRVIEGGPDRDITDHVPADSPAAKALAAMKAADDSFNVGEFLNGARAAYEMILMAFEAGDLEKIKPFLSQEVYESFAQVVEAREKKGLKIEAHFVGLREIRLVDAEFDPETKEGELTVRFVAELTSVVRDKSGEIVEGDPNEIKRQKDVWTFARIMGSQDPNWILVATGG